MIKFVILSLFFSFQALAQDINCGLSEFFGVYIQCGHDKQ